jgi:hypothetical protein
VEIGVVRVSLLTETLTTRNFKNKQGVKMSKKLWLLTGGAFAIGILISLLAIPLPSFGLYVPLAVIMVLGVWATLCVLVLLPEAHRTHKLVILVALALAVILSLSTQWFGLVAYFLGYFGIMFFMGAVLILGALQLFRRKPNLGILLLPLTMIMLGVGGTLLAGWSSRPGPAIPQQARSVSDELKYIYETDQSDRFNGRWLVDPERDRVRLERVKTLYHSGQITQPTDKFLAAFIFQHANCADEYQIAYELANAAAEQAVAEAQWLAQAAYDRWQLSLGNQQTYGTQLFPVPIKRPCLVM